MILDLTVNSVFCLQRFHIMWQYDLDRWPPTLKNNRHLSLIIMINLFQQFAATKIRNVPIGIASCAVRGDCPSRTTILHSKLSGTNGLHEGYRNLIKKKTPMIKQTQSLWPSKRSNSAHYQHLLMTFKNRCQNLPDIYMT